MNSIVGMRQSFDFTCEKKKNRENYLFVDLRRIARRGRCSNDERAYSGRNLILFFKINVSYLCVYTFYGRTLRRYVFTINGCNILRVIARIAAAFKGGGRG